MKKVLAVLLLISTISFTSCQKELALSDGNPTPTGGGTGDANANGITGGSNGTVLLRGVRVTGNDSVVVSIGYNSTDKFISYTALGQEKIDTMLANYNIRKYFTRDALGRITHIVQPNTMDTLIFGPLDSIRAVVNYSSAGSTEFTSIVTKADMGLANMVDSTLYTYVNGRVSQLVTWSSNDIFPMPPSVSARSEYKYDGAGNVIEVKSYSSTAMGGALELVSIMTATFDDKPNVHHWKNEGHMIGNLYYGPNNQTKVTVKNLMANQTTTVSFAYNYNSSNHPKNGQQVYNPPLTKSTLTYYYR